MASHNTSRAANAEEAQSLISTFRERHRSTIGATGPEMVMDNKRYKYNKAKSPVANQFVNYPRAQTTGESFMKRRKIGAPNADIKSIVSASRNKEVAKDYQHLGTYLQQMQIMLQSDQNRQSPAAQELL